MTLTLITYIPRCLLSFMAEDNFELSLTGIFKSLIITDHLPIPYFWFIQACFLLLIVNYTILSWCKNTLVPSYISFPILIILFVVMPFFISGEIEIFGSLSAIHLGLFFVLGAAYCEFYDYINAILPLDDIASFVISFSLWILLFWVGENTEIARIASIFGIIMSISLAKLLVKYNCTFLDHLTGANYIIFLLSWFFNVLTQQVLSHFIDLPWWIHSILSLTFGIYIPWLFYQYLKKHQNSRWVKYTSFLLGQSFKAR